MHEVTTKRGSTRLGWFIMAFGAVFVAAAGLVLLTIGSQIAETYQARGWAPVTAEITSTDLKRSYSDGSYTYLATGTFTYEYGGRAYTSDKIYPGTELYDSNKDYHAQTNAIMRDSMKRGIRHRAWVDPENPAEAVLFTDIRWYLFWPMGIFISVFALFGIGIFAAGYYTRKEALMRQHQMHNNPGQPWLSKLEWQTETIPSENRLSRRFALGFAAAINLVTWGVFIAVLPSILETKDYIWLAAAALPLLTAWMGYFILKYAQSAKRFENTCLTLLTYPAALGQRFEAVLKIGEDLPADTLFKLTYKCVRDFDDSDTSDQILWEKEELQALSQPRDRDLGSIKIGFDIPDDLPESLARDGRSDVVWSVQIKADIDGPAYDQTFEIPVFDPQKWNIPNIRRASGLAQDLRYAS